MSAQPNSEFQQVRTLFLVLLGMVLILRFAMAAFLGLSDDEAYYWNWSQHLSLSYFEHPGMTAWLIALSESIFGRSEFSVRLPAIILTVGTFYFLFESSKRHLDSSARLILLLLFTLIPIYSIGGQLMVPDLPLLFFWSVAYWALDKLLQNSQSKLFFFILIAAMGLAILSKMTAVLLCVSILLVAIVDRRLHHWLHPKNLLPAIALLALFTLPIVLWNHQNNWPMFSFHLSDRHHTEFSILRWFQFIASQMIYYTPFIFPFFFALIWNEVRILALHKPALSFRTLQSHQAAIIVGLPLILLFSLQPFVSEFKPHWTAPGFLLLLPFIASYMSKSIALSHRWDLFFKFSLFALFAVNLFFYASFFYPLLPKAHRFFTSANAEWNPKFDISNDFYGWDEVAKRVESLNLAENTFLASHRYQLTAPFAFYTGKRVYSFGKNSNQYVLFQTPEVINSLLGRNALFLSDNRYMKLPLNSMNFEKCESIEPLKVYRKAELARTFYFWICQNFLGPKEKK